MMSLQGNAFLTVRYRNIAWMSSSSVIVPAVAVAIAVAIAVAAYFYAQRKEKAAEEANKMAKAAEEAKRKAIVAANEATEKAKAAEEARKAAIDAAEGARVEAKADAIHAAKEAMEAIAVAEGAMREAIAAEEAMREEIAAEKAKREAGAAAAEEARARPRNRFKAQLEAHARDSPLHRLESSILTVANVDPADVAGIVAALRRKRLIRPISDLNSVVFKKLADVLVEFIDGMTRDEVYVLNSRSLARNVGTGGNLDKFAYILDPWYTRLQKKLLPFAPFLQAM